MNIKKLKLSSLKPLEQNVRKHGDKQLEHFQNSLRQFGQTRAFVVDEQNNVLVGNGMHEAMTRMGWEKPVDCHVVSGLTEAQKRKLILSDNKVFQLGSDNFDVIEQYLQEFADAGDFDIAGFDPETLESLARSADEVMQDMTSYGRLDDETVERIESSREDETQDEIAFASSPDEEEEDIDMIVCPHCGGAFPRGGQ
jgi:hypothetical protein